MVLFLVHVLVQSQKKSTLGWWLYWLLCPKHSILTLTFDLYLWPWHVAPIFDLDLWALHWPCICNQDKRQLHRQVCVKHWPLTLAFDPDLWPLNLSHSEGPVTFVCKSSCQGWQDWYIWIIGIYRNLINLWYWIFDHWACEEQKSDQQMNYIYSIWPHKIILIFVNSLLILLYHLL